jgi:hypothetical protein
MIEGHLSWTLWSGCGAWASEKYEAAFRENEINERVLPKLTAEDLKEHSNLLLGGRRLSELFSGRAL